MNIGLGQTQNIWVKEQTLKDTAVWPAAADAVLVSGEPKFDQAPSFQDDPQYRDTLDKVGRLRGLYSPGSFSFPAFIKASGSLGVVPVPGKLLKSLWGKETINTSTSVVYSQYLRGDEPIYLTILVKNNFETLLVQGLVVTKGQIKVVPTDSVDAFIAMTFSGGFLKMLHAGTDATVQLEAAAATTIHAVNARKFDVGQKIIIGSSGVTAGHLITARDLATNILTIAATGLETEQASGVTIKGWTPAVTEAGYLLHGRWGKYQEKEGVGSYADVMISDSDLEISNGFELINDVKTDDGYPYDFSGTQRDIKFNLSRYFVAAGTALFYEADAQVQKSIKLQAAAAAYSASSGKRFEIAMPNVQFDPPTRSGNKLIKDELKGYVYPTVALNDGATMTFA